MKTPVVGYKKPPDVLAGAIKKPTLKKPVRNNSGSHKNKLRILENVMKESDVSEMLYSIGSYMEEAICIDKQDENWIVYAGEIGNLHNLRRYPSFKRACADFLSRVSESDEQEAKLIDAYKTSTQKPRTRRTSLVKAAYGINVGEHMRATGKKH